MTASEEKSEFWHFWRWKMHWQVLLGIALGGAFGLLSGSVGEFTAGRVDGIVYNLGGSMFMNALKLIVVPLIGLSMITSVTGLKGESGLGKMGLKTVLLYATTSLIAILIGLAVVNIIQPGNNAGMTPDEIQTDLAQDNSQSGEKLQALEQKTAGASTSDILAVFKSLVPSNIFSAAASGNLLGVIFFSLLVGFILQRLPDSDKKTYLVGALDAAYDVIMGVTHVVLKFLPIGVMALVALTVASATANNDLMTYLTSLMWFVVAVVLALALHMFGTISVLLATIGRVNPIRFFKAMAPASLTAFSTAPSAATVPVTMETLEDNAEVSKRVASFVIPIGATINMDGTALYEGMVVIFLAQLLGIDLSFAHQFTILALALLTSIGVAGIPSASLVAIVIIIDAVNKMLPEGQEIVLSALGIIFVFDRLLDMCRTAVNVTGDAAVACLIARGEGEEILNEDD